MFPLYFTPRTGLHRQYISSRAEKGFTFQPERIYPAKNPRRDISQPPTEEPFGYGTILNHLSKLWCPRLPDVDPAVCHLNLLDSQGDTLADGTTHRCPQSQTKQLPIPMHRVLSVVVSGIAAPFGPAVI